MSTTEQNVSRLRIVILDDEQCITEFYSTVLARMYPEAEISIFDDGMDAWRNLLTSPPDLLITDVNRAGMSGWEMLPLLAKRQVHFPVLVISGQAIEQQVKELSGPNLRILFLSKPASASALRTALSACIGEAQREVEPDLSRLQQDSSPAIGKRVWHSAIDIGIAGFKAGDSLETAIEKALAHVRFNASGYDETQLRAKLEAVITQEQESAPVALPVALPVSSPQECASITVSSQTEPLPPVNTRTCRNMVKDAFKSVGALILGLFAFVAAIMLVVTFIKGSIWVSEKVYPWLTTIASVTLLITLAIFLPLALFRRTRSFAALSIYAASYVFGLTLWVWSLLLSYSLWGVGAVLVGLFLYGIGVVPIAMLATMLNGMWPVFGWLIFLAILTFGGRIFGIHLAAVAKNHEADEAKKGNYFIRHWRGELSLGVSYWANGFLAWLMVALAAGFISPMKESASLRATAVACILLYLFSLAASFWQIIGTWRSASKHVGRGGQPIWAGVAKVFVVLGFLNLLRFTANTVLPQSVEFANIALGDKGMPAYEIRVLPGGNEIEFRGGLRAGSAKELERILKAVPQATVLHLNSVGGRVHEGEEMARLVRERGLTTYTSEQCLSAATLVFIAGKERVVAANAKLGFHRATVPGITTEQQLGSNESLRQTMMAAGVSKEFIDRVMATPSEDMWYPSVEEMQRARVITGESHGERFAVSGAILRNSLEDIDKVFSALPGFRAIKELEPDTYRKMFSDFSAAIQSGKSEGEAQSIIRGEADRLMLKYLPAASSEALLAMRDLWVKFLEDFKGKDSRACIAMISPQVVGPRYNYGRIVSEWNTTNSWIVIEKVLRSAAAGSPPPMNAKVAEEDLARIRLKLSGKYGDDLALLAKENEWLEHSERVCEMLLAFYRETQGIPDKQQANLLRYLYAQNPASTTRELTDEEVFGSHSNAKTTGPRIKAEDSLREEAHDEFGGVLVEVKTTESKPKRRDIFDEIEADTVALKLKRYPYTVSASAPGNHAEAQAIFTVGLARQRSGDLETAMLAYRTAILLDPAFFEAQYNLGVAAYDAGQISLALTAYETALVLRPDSRDTRYNFALSLRVADYPVDAAEELKKLLVTNANESRVHFSLGNLYAQQLGQPKLAREHYQRVLALEPNHPQAATLRTWLATHPEHPAGTGTQAKIAAKADSTQTQLTSKVETKANIGTAEFPTEFTNLSGVVYRNVRVQQVYENGIVVSYVRPDTMRDLAKIRFTEISQEWQKYYGYDPKKAAALDEKERQRKELFAPARPTR